MASPLSTHEPATRNDAPPSIREVLRTLAADFHDDVWHWMPEHIDGPMDVIVGAILVQHTNWTNAVRALEALRAASALDPAALAAMPAGEIAALVRVSGTPTIKARRLQAIARTILDAAGLDAMLSLPTETLRARLLATHGIGPETADAIALYAAGRRVFVIDAYTRRLLRRIGLGPASDRYDAWQAFLEDALGQDATVDDYRRYHAAIVLHCKALCRATPICAACPLRLRCATGAAAA